VFLYEIIESFAKKNNIIAGACHAVPIDSARLSASPFVPFVSSDLKKRTDPTLSLRGVESIIVIGVGHSPGFARLSSLGTNNDYHPRVKNLLCELTEELKTHSDFKYKILVDSPALDERALAERAGLGFFGRNGLIISKKFGSRFNIGCLLTDLKPGDKRTIPLPYPTPVNCPPECDLCIKSCPTDALSGKNLNAAQCISYLTQKGELSCEEEKMLSGQLYGCDICQDVCPFNEKVQSVTIDPQEWLTMSDEDFQKKYGHTAMLWRGVKIPKRNAHIFTKNLEHNSTI